MFLQNYYNYLNGVALYDAANDKIAESTVVDFTGTERNVGYAPHYYGALTSFGVDRINSGTGTYTTSVEADDTEEPYIIFGDGTVEPALNDYNLSGNRIILTNLSNTLVREVKDNEVVHNRLFTIQNNTSESVTISEFGLIFPMGWHKIGYNYYCMFYRALLPEPITIEAGNTGTIKISIPVPLVSP